MQQPPCIGIDLGATRIKAVLLDTAGNILARKQALTEDNSDGAWKTVLKELVEEWDLHSDLRPLPVGISAPGISNEANTAIQFMPGRMQGLENFDWSIYLQRPVRILNDALAALLAEARLGAARDCRQAILLTLGTGVGGAILLNGEIYQGAFHKAGHLGHMVIDPDGEPDVTGMPGSLELAVGNLSLPQRSGGRFRDTKELLEALQSGDAVASQVWRESVRKLALGIASLTNILSPEAVILAGGIAEAGDSLFQPLEEYLARYEWRVGGQRARLLQARFGEWAGAIGAACFAREQTL